jgi:hypothetical protein
MLNTWEFEWYKAFHLLRDGAQLPVANPSHAVLTRDEIDARIHALEQMTIEKFIAKKQSEVELRPLNVRDQWHIWTEWAELERSREISELRRLRPKEIYALAERREIWNALVNAHTLAAVRQACQRWERLPDVRAKGFQCFPAHVLSNTRQFVLMKRNRRFPRSVYADDPRLEYLARGMAGVMVNVSPMTAIERLRNMKHKAAGSLWNEKKGHCDCWRCEYRRWYELSEAVEQEIIKKGDRR